jgi:cytoskeleton protein RodZ
MQGDVTAIGERIKQARVQRGLTLRDIARMTKITERLLAAVERDDFASLPPGIFRRACIRAFASAVGLEGAQCSREYVTSFEPEPPPEPVPQVRKELIDFADRLFARPGTALAGLMGIGALSAFVTFGAVAARSSPGSADAGRRDAPAPALTQRPAVTESAGVDSPRLRVEIRPTRSCWVSASADGESVVYRLLRRDEHTVVEAHDVITLKVGDAGAVAYSVNGAPGRPLGRSGEVVTVRITPDDVQPIGSSGTSRAAFVVNTE